MISRLSSQRKYLKYPKQRYDGGPKNQFWSTVTPFLSNNNRCNIMLYVNNTIVSDLVAVANIFNKYFTDIADNIGFNDPISVD